MFILVRYDKQIRLINNSSSSKIERCKKVLEKVHTGPIVLKTRNSGGINTEIDSFRHQKTSAAKYLGYELYSFIKF